jgi:hypothetical protein
LAVVWQLYAGIDSSPIAVVVVMPRDGGSPAPAQVVTIVETTSRGRPPLTRSPGQAYVCPPSKQSGLHFLDDQAAWPWERSCCRDRAAIKFHTTLCTLYKRAVNSYSIVHLAISSRSKNIDRFSKCKFDRIGQGRRASFPHKPNSLSPLSSS